MRWAANSLGERVLMVVVMVVVVVVVVEVVLVLVVMKLRNVLTECLQSGETGAPGCLLQLMYRLELSWAEMAEMAFSLIWLSTMTTCLVRDIWKLSGSEIYFVTTSRQRVRWTYPG